MENKLTIQDLGNALAERCGLPRRETDNFARLFFDTISEHVLSEKIVKVKGLGTFKLVEVLERESVNVNTGERIRIPGHSKVSFTPDPVLRDRINKPFADFQTVVINDGTSLEDMERMDDDVVIPEEDEDVETVENVENVEKADTTEAPLEEEPTQTATAAEPETVEKPEPVVAPELVVAPAPAVAPESAVSPAPTVAPEPAAESSSAVTATSLPEGRRCSVWCHVLCTLLVLLLMVASYVAGYYRVIPLEEWMQPRVETTQEEAVPEQPDSTLIARQLAEQAEQARRDSMRRVIDSYEQLPGGEYLIVGTKSVHVMKRGDQLFRIALKEYGHKDFARYIIVHNRFANPDRIPLGYEVKLPELVEVGNVP